MTRSKPARPKSKARRKPVRAPGEWWSQRVTQTSNALTLEPAVFTSDDPKKVARSLKRSAEKSSRRKSDPYRSAMSMLSFYINRAGRRLPKRRMQILQRARNELRGLFGRPRQH